MPLDSQKRFNVLVLPLAVLLLLLASKVQAQVPEGWYATSQFRFCRGFPPSSGGVQVIDPSTLDAVNVEGLPEDLRSEGCGACAEGSAGGGSILVRREDGAVLVGESAQSGEDLEIFLLELDGFTVARTTRYLVLAGDGPTCGGTPEVSDMEWLSDGRVLFAASADETGTVVVVGTLDLSAPPEQAVRTVDVPFFGGLNTLAVDENERRVYLGLFLGQGPNEARSELHVVDLDAVLESENGGTLDSGSTSLFAELPLGITAMDLREAGELVLVGFGPQSGLRVLDIESGQLARLCDESAAVQGDSNALAIHPETGEVILATGGPWNPPPAPWSDALVRLDPEASCAPTDWVSSPLVLSGVAVRGLAEESPRFLRGDANADGQVNVADGVSTLSYLFGADQALPCLDAADTDDSGQLDISDPVRIFNWLFLGGTPPAPPGYQDCGEDPTAGDSLECAEYMSCP